VNFTKRMLIGIYYQSCVLFSRHSNLLLSICVQRKMCQCEIYPIVSGLVSKRFVESTVDSATAAEVKRLIRDDIMSRYGPTGDVAPTSLPALMALLDPRHKKLTFFTPAQRKKTHAILESRFAIFRYVYPSIHPRTVNKLHNVLENWTL
jgi:hypothetical protein